MARLFAGTSGFSYPAWKPDFYPKDLPSKRFLEYYATRLNSVEANYTFRRLAPAKVLEGWKDKPTRLVFGMLKTHDAEVFLRQVGGFAEELAGITIPREVNALSDEAAAEAARAAGMRAHASPSLAEAVNSVAKPDSRVLICGSLYLAGRVLEENG